MFQTIKQVLSLLSDKERKRMILVFSINLIMSVIEVIGITSILPFISVATNPDMIHGNKYFSAVFQWFGFSNDRQFLLFFGLAVLFILIFSNLARALGSWLTHRFAAMCMYGLSTRLLRHYLRQTYVFFLNRNSSELSKNVLGEARTLAGSIVSPVMDIGTKLFLVVLIMGMLFWVNAVVSLVILFILGGTYVIVYFAFNKTINTIGQKRLEAERDRYKATFEAFGGIKDIKLLGREQVYIDYYSAPAFSFAQYDAQNAIIGDIPKYIIEGFAFGFVMLVLLYLLMQGKTEGQAFALISLYAFSAYRLLPALQAIFLSANKIRYGQAVGRMIYSELTTGLQATEDKHEEETSKEVLAFRKNIKLENMVFSYPKTDKPVLKKINLTIPVNTTIGFVGTTGSGKTTMIDIILGLLRPQEGFLSIDSTEISDKILPSWQKNIGYVSQHIYLTDDTVRKNIAFGVSDSEINQDAIVRAAKIANIHQFIISEMHEGYNSIVGDRGIRLSGGQRQRIGIARALYHNPSVLVLDEATSALDMVTENSIMEAINELSHKKTIIMIAHRLTTVEDCDTIFFLNKGEICAYGTYEELLETSSSFRKFAKKA